MSWDRGWSMVMVPRDARRATQELPVAEGQLYRWQLLVGSLVLVSLVCVAALWHTWPRSTAYDGLVHENLVLKDQLDSLDAKMGDIDRLLLRLRLYDAQLQSLGGATGDHGPLPADVGSAPHPGLSEDMPAPTMHQPAGPDGRRRPAERWAQDLESRATTFLDVFARTEPSLSQLVGEREALMALQRALPSQWPAKGPFTSGYGWRRNPMGTQWQHHGGIDVGGDRGDPIVSAGPGTVARAGWSEGYGKRIEIDHGFGITTLYAHCSRLLVQPGDQVLRGQRLGSMGSTGRSTGPHLHFEVRLDGNAVDPMDYLRRRRPPPWGWR